MASDAYKKITLNYYLQFLKTQPTGFVYRKTAKTKNIINDKNEQLCELKKLYKNCQSCPLANQGRSRVVFGDENPYASIMFIGEGPGRDEDEQGIPFVGRAGQLLTKIIQAMGIKRKDVYISNVVKCRPPENRAPLLEESKTCTKLILFKEIEIVKPQIICTLGATALQALLGREAKITKCRGIFANFQGIEVMPTYHPAYLLRKPEAKKVVWDDMKKIMAKLSHV